jgi:protein-tyrosine phosphatase
MAKKKPNHVVLNSNKIDSHIWIGSNQCCEMHFDKKLLKKGINSDISLEENRVDAPFGVESYLWLPTMDHTPPSVEQLELGTWHIKNLVNTRRKVYVHCKNGHGRAPTLVAAYYIREGMTVDAAMKKIKTKRKEVHFEKSQIAALKKFKVSL